jgi:hypothetical protein
VNGIWFELSLAAALLLIALTFWLAVQRHWRPAGGAFVGLLTLLPMVRLSMASEFRLSAALVSAAGLLAGLAVALSGSSRRR